MSVGTGLSSHSDRVQRDQLRSGHLPWSAMSRIEGTPVKLPHRESRLAAALEQERSECAQERLEAEATKLETYRQTTVAAAVSSEEMAPQFAAMITGSSKEEIDAKVEQAKAATAEILAEVAGQQPGQTAEQDEQDQFIPAPQSAVPDDQYLPPGLTPEEQQAAEDGSLSLRDYAALRSRLRLAGRDVGIFG